MEQRNIKKLIFLTICLLLISPYAYSNIYEFSDLTPEELIPAEFLSNLTNSTFEMITEGFSNEDINIYVANHDVIIANSKILLMFFYIASLLKQIDSIETFTPYTFFKSTLYLFMSIWLINNSEIVFTFISDLRDIIAVNMDINKHQLIDFNNIIQDWYRNKGSVDLISKTEETFLIVSYTQSMLLSLIAILIIGVVLVIRIIKLQIYQIIAPYMFAAVTFKDSINLTIAFLKDYIITYFMIILIVFITNKYLQFGNYLSTNYLMVFLQNTLLSVIVVKIKTLSFGAINLGKKAFNLVSTIKNNPDKIKTVLNMSRRNLNNRGYAPIANNLSSTLPNYFNRRKDNVKTILSKEGRMNISKDNIKNESIKFTKETYGNIRDRLNNTGYASNINRIPSHLKSKVNSIKEIFKKED